MKELTLSAGQIACKLTLLRKLLPQDLLVSHYDADMKVFKVDSALGDFRVADPSKVIAFQKALDHILDRTSGTHPHGRPKRDRVTMSIRLTPAVRLYAETLCATTQVSMSTLISYLICVAHGAYQDTIASGGKAVIERPEDLDMTDEVAFVEVMKRMTFAPNLEQARKRDVMREFAKEREEQNAEIAQIVRQSIDEKEAEKREKKRLALAAEERADKRLKDLDR